VIRGQPPAPRIAVDLRVEAGAWPPVRALRKLAAAAFDATVSAANLPLAPGAEVSAVFTDDAHMRVLNKRYRGKGSSTNVLSFPTPRSPAGVLGPMLGDIVLAAETVAREAAAERLALEARLTHLLVHGFLHLAGYDHEDDGDATVMEGLETAILQRLGIDDPHRQ
jgi:probable rRNA maturation factor